MDQGNASTDATPHPFDDYDHVRERSDSSLNYNQSRNSSKVALPLTESSTQLPVSSFATSHTSGTITPANNSTMSLNTSANTSAGTTIVPTPIFTSSSAQSMVHSTRHHHTSNHPPVTPLQTSSTGLNRWAQAFSPLLSSRRKSTVIDIPSTPDSHKSFTFGLSSSVHANSGSLYNYHSSASQEHLASSNISGGGNGNNSTSSFLPHENKINFNSGRSNRSRKTHPGGMITHVSEESSGSGSFAAPPHTATAFHTGLSSHFGVGSSSSSINQNYRDSYHESGHREGKGSIISTGSSVVEKTLKKTKVFFDEKAKPKARAASLWSFLDVTFEFDQAKFFQEHADQVFAVTHDTFWHQINKFKQRPDRNNTLQSKEVIAIQKTLLLLRLIFLYLPDKIKNGWHKRPIANILAQVLCHKNHPRIRIFGFRLLLLWINDQTVECPEAIYLFSNAISLDLFMYDGEDISVDHAMSSQTKLPHINTGSAGRRAAKQVSQYLELTYVNLNQELLQSDGPPICPNPFPPTFQDSIQLFQIFLGNIVRMAYVGAGSTPPPGELESISSHHPLEVDGKTGDGIAVGFGLDAGLAAARFMFDIIKKYYLVKLFPECARNLQLIKDEKEFGYKTCPPTILRTIISFVIQYCLDSNEFNSRQGPTSPAIPILKKIVYSSEANREIMHEIVRQGLSLPAGHPQYKDIVRGAIHIMGVWCLSGEQERPAFLRSSAPNRSQVPSSVSLASLGSQESGGSQSGSQQQTPTTSPTEHFSTSNSFLQRYFQMLTNVFAENPVTFNDLSSNSSSEALGTTGNQVKLDSDALFHLYKDIVGLFRAILARCQIEMDAKSWEILLGSLLEIQRRIISMYDKLSSVMSSSIDELLSFIIETVLCAYSRCPNVTDAQWIALRKTVTESLRFSQTVSQWVKWSVRLTNILSNEVYQVDLEAQATRPVQASATRHARKMSDKFRHSRYFTSKTENPMRHSIGGELLSSQGIPYTHQAYPLLTLNAQERASSRRANSVQYDPAKQGGPNTNTSGTTYTPTLLGHSFLSNRDQGVGREFHSSVRATAVDVGEVEDEDLYDNAGSHISTLGDVLDTSDEKLHRTPSLLFHGPDSLHMDPIVERLSPLYGTFAAPDFVNISMKGRSPENILSVWKNIVCSIGNPNEIQIPLVKTEVMLCLFDIWDLLNQIRTSQPLDATVIPPLYDFAPWFFEAANSTSDGGVGLPAIYGGLCRMMSRRYDQDFDPEYYQLFYNSVIQGLKLDDSMIVHSILANSSRLFTLSLPGSHILVLPFLTAIRQMLLKDEHLRDGVNHFIRKQAIAILCSVSMLFYDFGYQNANEHSKDNSDDQQKQGPLHNNASASLSSNKTTDLLAHKLTFTRLVLDLTLAEANVKPLTKFWDTHSMLIQLCGMLVINEWSSSLATCDISAESDLLSLVLDHLYWTEASIVQSAVEVITTLAGMYQDHEDNGWIILEMVLSHLLSAMQEHLKLFQSDARRGATIATFYRCLIEWLMVIPARAFSETELSKWAFELIETGLLCGPDSTGENDRKRALQAAKQQYQQNEHSQQYYHQRQSQQRKRGPSFKYTGKTIHHHHRVMVNAGPAYDVEAEQLVVKEAAEATLIHLIHFMNNFSSHTGSERPAIAMGLDKTSGKGELNGIRHNNNNSPNSKRDSELETQRIFALNDSILITLEEIPPVGPMGLHRTRVIIRDETGRYAWDSEIFYKEMLEIEESNRPRSVQRTGSRLSERFGSSPRRRKKEMASQLVWREGIKIREDEVHSASRVSNSASIIPSSAATSPEAYHPPSLESLLWDGGASSRSDGDMLDRLLCYIGDMHPDCLFDGKTPLNRLNNGMTLSTESGNTDNYFGNGIGSHMNSSSNNGHGFNGSTVSPGGRKRSTIDFELNRHVQEENYYTRISDPQARAWYDKLLELRSSLIQTDDDIEEHSNTLMALVINSSSESKRGDSQIKQEDSGNTDVSLRQIDNGIPLSHNELYNRAKRYSGRRISQNSLQDLQAGATTALELDGALKSNEKDVLAAGLLKEDATNMAKAFQLVLPPEPERPLDSYQHSRLLLSHLGLLCFDRFQEHNFVLLNQTASLNRDLISLDKKSGRETFKIAILYVAAGQEGEKMILHNSKGSTAYDRFVHDLGWEVDLAEHNGYMGGLERNGSNGRTAMYYCSSTLEVLFHEVVRMPTDPNDPRQVKKKRHVGNDHVHIVWSEHSRPYDRSTIGGDFGNVVIVLTPIPDIQVDQGVLTIHRPSAKHEGSGLVSVEVIRDTNLPVFGPLVDGMVVPMAQLGRLVRQTAIHAARLATAPPPLPPTPMSAPYTGPGSTFGSAVGSNSGVNNNNTSFGNTGGIGSGPSGVSVSGQRGYHSQPISSSQINAAIHGHQYYLSSPFTHVGTPSVQHGSGSGTAVGGAQNTVGVSSSSGAGAMTGSSTNLLAAVTVTPVSGTSPSSGTISDTLVAGGHLTASASTSTLGNVGSGPKAASVSSLVSNSGSINDGVSRNNSGSSNQDQGSQASGAANNNNGSQSGINSLSMYGAIGSSTGGAGGSMTTLTSILAQPQQQPSSLTGQQGVSGSTNTNANTTMSSTFSASMLAMTHSAHPFKQRLSAIEQIVKRHKVEKWTFQQFMEQVFGYSTLQHSQNQSRKY
ncbi:hypothetical protein BCR41DRAFT_324938 [Lobosporangium transversale]|uniref:Rap-GAP domain-containing protein n=1 Tax=Lobosporangium transversale TaxID=64571 RepID=A0A1Y2GL41_9FUNG|nr:hypothetical protein BCR41DRAFT_324938 [Lobosporangium transversale]ORZ10641.1 hypothetical protein BCR41DRAFT_324938 [Lobosporangium transversale]|eukprot:XP_021879362.1 hypothetical protein BCR41DRAFT_324938 [Lobosporangium transversale]